MRDIPFVSKIKYEIWREPKSQALWFKMDFPIENKQLDLLGV
jgi:hypothetical protein